MIKGYVLYSSDDMYYFAGGFYVDQGEKYPNISKNIAGAKVYKSKVRLMKLLNNGIIPCAGGWRWEIKDVSE